MTVRFAAELARGERLSLVGRSGAGKSTVLEAIAGIAPLRRGALLLDGAKLHAPGRRGGGAHVGLLTQQPLLFPHLSLAENLAYSPRSEPVEVQRLAAALGIGDLLSSHPNSVSGGQAQRCALGRLLASRPDLLLLDEPFSALDWAARRELMAMVIGWLDRTPVPAILVTHDIAEAQAFGSRVAVMDEGSVVQIADPAEIVRRPRSRRIAALVGYCGFAPLPGQRTAGVHPDLAAVAPPSEGDPAGRFRLEAVVLRCTASGPRWACELAVGGTTVLASSECHWQPGAAVHLLLDSPPLFGADGELLGGQGSARECA